MTTTCPHCGKSVAGKNALWQHVKSMHGAKAAKVFKQPRESEQSIADELVEAIEAHAAGIAPPDHLLSMFPEAFNG